MHTAMTVFCSGVLPKYANLQPVADDTAGARIRENAEAECLLEAHAHSRAQEYSQGVSSAQAGVAGNTYSSGNFQSRYVACGLGME